MALVRWEPAREINAIQQEMNRLFSTFFDAPANGSSSSAAAAPSRWVPAMDLVETDDHFVLRADLPGMTEQDVELEVERDVLTLSGERQIRHEAKKDGFYRLERASGAFSRSLTLPEGVEADAIEATFDHGVLEVRIPKPAERRPQRVEIAVGSRRPAIEAEAAAAAPTN